MAVGLVEADRYHRSHAVCELAIRDLKGSGGLAHLPSGIFTANAVWLLCAALAHNLYRQIAIPRGNPTVRPPGMRTYRPDPTVRGARTPRQPQRTTCPASSGPMALGRGLPDYPR